ncbi:hypothetical protein VC885_25575, partial [Citrobacter freundii]|nr:hypothetical protein [Citrobacter freundii]MEB0857531.1 hypothetical protein [Citrobacter freundii]
GCPQTNRKTDTGKTLKPWPVLVDHYKSKSDSYECDATCFARAVEQALLAPSFEEAKIILERVRSDNREYF